MLQWRALADFLDDNEITFTQFRNSDWIRAPKKLHSFQTVWEELIAKATDIQLIEWSQEIGNISLHNTYHTGQIVYIQKMNGWWE